MSELLFFIGISQRILGLSSLFISPQASCQKFLLQSLSHPYPHYSFSQNSLPPTLFAENVHTLKFLDISYPLLPPDYFYKFIYTFIIFHGFRRGFLLFGLISTIVLIHSKTVLFTFVLSHKLYQELDIQSCVMSQGRHLLPYPPLELHSITLASPLLHCPLTCFPLTINKHSERK